MPSLYESTVNTGEVSSSNFTTLYNASGLSVPNAGAGSVTGNLNVGGNLTVQGTSLLIGDVTLQSTLSLPNYTFPLPDGTTDQVLVTDGNGNVYWSNVQALPGASYTIEANSTTGGANLTLVSAAGPTDSVKFAGSAHITVTQTDASTITISTDADNIPDGTADGQVLVWESSAWTANNAITSTALANRFNPIYKNNSIGSSVMAINRNYDSSTYTTGSLSAIGYQVSSNTQTATQIGRLGFLYDATNPSLLAQVSTDNFVTNKSVIQSDATNTVLYSPNLYLNGNHGGSGVATNATIQVVRYGSGSNATLTWNESSGKWIFNTGMVANGDSTIVGTLTATGDIYTQSEGIHINTDSTAADSYLYFKGSTQYLKWNNAQTRFDLSNSLNVSGDITGSQSVTSPQFVVTAPNFSSITLGGTLTTTSTTQTSLVTEAGPLMKIVLSIKDNVTNAIHGVELLAIQSGSTVMLTTYAELYTSSALATFAVDQSGGVMRLLVTPASTNSTSFSYLRTAVEA